jgi:hypothetical protein
MSMTAVVEVDRPRNGDSVITDLPGDEPRRAYRVHIAGREQAGRVFVGLRAWGDAHVWAMSLVRPGGRIWHQRLDGPCQRLR